MKQKDLEDEDVVALRAHARQQIVGAQRDEWESIRVAGRLIKLQGQPGWADVRAIAERGIADVSARILSPGEDNSSIEYLRGMAAGIKTLIQNVDQAIEAGQEALQQMQGARQGSGVPSVASDGLVDDLG